ncbi:MAG TPA: SDR family oxidoreductase [Tenuifilaceae bacterium]|nr:SDR family oxidoreductase [Tenuifilaceae bacterium]
MAYLLKGKIAVVTGASSGIGRAIAIELARSGVKVVLASRDEQRLNNAHNKIREIGGESAVVKTDVADELQCKELIRQTISQFGGLDILINNAGISMRANFLDVDLKVLKRLVDTNFWGSVYCTKYALPYIVEHKGSIVAISSVSGVTPLPGRTGYVASKHALDGFMGTIRVENLHTGIHVMVVHPGFTTSNIRNVALNKLGLPQAETPLDESKLMPAEEVARRVVHGIVKRKHTINLTLQGKFAIWLYRHAPKTAERLIFNSMKKEVGAPF